jgi:hypothetical protein
LTVWAIVFCPFFDCFLTVLECFSFLPRLSGVRHSIFCPANQRVSADPKHDFQKHFSFYPLTAKLNLSSRFYRRRDFSKELGDA